MGKFKRGPRAAPSLLCAALAGALAGIAAPAQAQQAISTVNQWNGAQNISDWGTLITATYGQTLSAGNTLSVLGTFTFYVQTSGLGAVQQQYKAYVYEWNPATQRIVGPALFASPVLTAPVHTAAFTPVTVNTGGVGLVPGKTYVFFVTISGLPAQGNGAYRFGSVAGNSYAGGQFVFINNNTLDFSLLSSQAWRTLAANPDLAMVLGMGPSSMAAPLFSSGLNSITLDAMRDVNRVVQARLDGETGISAGDAFEGNRDGWMKPYGAWAQQNTREGNTGYKTRGSGIAFGTDRSLSPRSRVGIAAALGQVQVNALAPTNQQATIQTYTLIGYGRHGIDERTDLTWQLDGGLADNHGTRKLDFFAGDNTANSRFNALTAHAGVAVSRNYSMGADSTFSPALRVDYAAIRSYGYQEEGGGQLGLNVRPAVNQELILGADARLANKIDSKKTFTANLGLGYDVLNKRNSVTAAYLVGTDDIKFYGMRRSPLLLRGGVGMNLTRVGKTQVALRYDVELRESFVNQTASVNVRVPF